MSDADLSLASFFFKKQSCNCSRHFSLSFGKAWRAPAGLFTDGPKWHNEPKEEKIS